jgi:sugar lactone lactonase YvrE
VTQSLETTLLVDGFAFGEGPRWHGGKLWFTDGPRGAVLSVDAAGHLAVEVETEHPSGLGWLPDGTLLICTLLEAKIKEVGPGGVRVVHDLSDLAWSTNDMVVSLEGRVYVDLYQRTDTGIAGEIGLVTLDGLVRVVATGLATPNGLGITPDGSTLLVSETQGSRLLAYRIQPDGGLADQRVFAELGQARRPDGLCLDAEGAVWVGCYDTGEFLRVLDGGEITHRVEVGRVWSVAPALGGDDRRTLYLIVNDTTREEHARGESRGRIQQVRVEIPGVGLP